MNTAQPSTQPLEKFQVEVIETVRYLVPVEASSGEEAGVIALDELVGGAPDMYFHSVEDRDVVEVRRVRPRTP